MILTKMKIGSFILVRCNLDQVKNPSFPPLMALDGDFIDDIHVKWWGDYGKLEVHHGYIQWLFPIREEGMNWDSQALQLHELQKLKVPISRQSSSTNSQIRRIHVVSKDS